MARYLQSDSVRDCDLSPEELKERITPIEIFDENITIKTLKNTFFKECNMIQKYYITNALSNLLYTL